MRRLAETNQNTAVAKLETELNNANDEHMKEELVVAKGKEVEQAQKTAAVIEVGTYIY